MDYERARFNMIEQQIRPWEVLDQDVLDLLSVVKREQYVPPAYQALAFTDMEIPLNLGEVRTGQAMFSPKLEARLLQNLAVRKHEHVLEVGAGSGYMAALLAHRARMVVSYEIDSRLASFAAANLLRDGVRNAEVRGMDANAGKQDERFEVIVFSGSVEFVPDAWKERLNVGGRLVAIVGEAPVMEARLITRTSAAGFTEVNLFETSAPALSGFPRREHFTF